MKIVHRMVLIQRLLMLTLAIVNQDIQFWHKESLEDLEMESQM